MEDDKITIEIDLNNDFDGLDLELAIIQSEGKAKEILTLLHHKWVNQIGHPELSRLNIYRKEDTYGM